MRINGGAAGNGKGVKGVGVPGNGGDGGVGEVPEGLGGIPGAAGDGSGHWRGWGRSGRWWSQRGLGSSRRERGKEKWGPTGDWGMSQVRILGNSQGGLGGREGLLGTPGGWGAVLVSLRGLGDVFPVT